MNIINLKMDLTEVAFQNRIQYNPNIIELALFPKDINNTYKLEKRIEQLQSMGVKVYLHHPMQVNGKPLDIVSTDKEVQTYTAYSTGVLASIAQRHGVDVVIHANYSEEDTTLYKDIPEPTLIETMELKSRLEYYHAMGADKHFLWENSTYGLYSTRNPYLFDEVIIPLNLPVTWDISHAFIGVNGNNAQLLVDIDKVNNYAKYFHVVDSMGLIHDSLVIGEGLINWKPIVPYIFGKDFIFEIGLTPPHTNCEPMVRSAKYMENMFREYLTIK